MRKLLAVLGSVVFFVVAPGVVAGLAPWWISGRGSDTASLGWPLRGLGAVLIAAGAGVLLDSFARFALQGSGTPAPVFPTRHLVVSGLYRYVRNPMYVAVVAVIVGQSLLLGNARVLAYGAAVGVGFHVFVLLYEEATLRSTYGEEYVRFCAHVPRWIPRLRPWQPRDALAGGSP
jgi:protein-S-isoprenylcysteine O-methyltransferase Ste14